ncbi:hypothetical protein ACJJI5_12930 [Microbulbifer sp. EKSA008]|uniref:hypothetical protein n=1 Tax=Microbulbifer sp. EKSA008 TaxID=3243367 RepID=UPI00404210EF
MLTLFLLTIFAIITGVIFAFKKLVRVHFLLMLSILFMGSVVVIKVYEQRFNLSFVPNALQVSSISYNEGEAWGFGPGGNEVGIRVYPLSEEIANQITEGGIEYFNSLPANRNKGVRREREVYGSWNETPIKEEKYWRQREGGSLGIYNYLCRYGFCIDVDEEIVKQSNAIINSPGNYYAYGRVGLIVVSPSEKLVIYMFSG